MHKTTLRSSVPRSRVKRRPAQRASGRGMLALAFVVSLVLPTMTVAGLVVQDLLPTNLLEKAAPPVEPAPSKSFLAPRMEPKNDSADASKARADTTLPEEIPAAVREVLMEARAHYYELGFDLPPTDFGSWDENSTLTFTYPMGDLDGDGVDDVGVSTYCVDVAHGCDPKRQINPTDPPTLPNANAEEEKTCGVPHKVSVVGGSNGTELWSARAATFREAPNLRREAFSYSGYCLLGFVVASVATGNGSAGLLVYLYEPRGPQDPDEGLGTGTDDTTIQRYHRFLLLDGKTGRALWTITNRSITYSNTKLEPDLKSPRLFNSTRHIENEFIHPILQVPSTQGVRLSSTLMPPTLFLQGVGREYWSGPTQEDIHGQNEVRYFQSNKADEWVARIDPRTGQQLWWTHTFDPDTQSKNTWPEILHRPSPPPFWIDNEPRWAHGVHWGAQRPCCLDVTGDQVPDVVYTTTEVHPNEYDNPGPYDAAGRLIVFDGSTGSLLYSKIVEPGTRAHANEESSATNFDAPTAFELWGQLVGDVNGDGSGDVLVHLVYYLEQYHHVLSTRDGRTGEELARFDSPRDLKVLPLGDANGDGGADYLVVGWYVWQFPSFFDREYYDYNVTVYRVSAMDAMTGKELWAVDDFHSPMDYHLLWQTLELNGGLPDVNNDGAGDFLTDDPYIADDFTLVHRHDVISGRTGRPLSRITTVGELSIPMSVGDLDGDGGQDVGILTGDVVDLWFTTYTFGVDEAATPAWSARVNSPRTVEYLSIDPRVRAHAVQRTPAMGNDLLVNLQLEVEICGTSGCSKAMYKQVAWLLAEGQEQAPWAIPAYWGGDAYFIVIEGATSGVGSFWYGVEKTYAAEATGFTVAPEAWYGAGAFGATWAVNFPLARALLRRRLRA